MQKVIINEKKGIFEVWEIESGELLENSLHTLQEAEEYAKENNLEVVIVFTNTR